jgi:hypothetical protein
VVDDHRPQVAHAEHDAVLIAALAAGDLGEGEQRRARSLVATCPACAALAADLESIRSATTASNLVVPPRPRSFVLSPGDASRLQRGRWRQLLSGLGGGLSGGLRPLAAGLTTLGLAGLLLSTLSVGPSTGGDLGPMRSTQVAASEAPTAAGAPADASAQASLAPEIEQASSAPGGSVNALGSAYPDASQPDVSRPPTLSPAPSASAQAPATGPDDPRPDRTGGPSPLVVLSTFLLAAGLGLFAVGRVMGGGHST